MTTIRNVANIAGHELIHTIHYVNGSYKFWLAFGSKIADAFTEFEAYGWNKEMGGYYNKKLYEDYRNIIDNFKNTILR